MGIAKSFTANIRNPTTLTDPTATTFPPDPLFHTATAANRLARLQAVTASLSEALTVEQMAHVVTEQGVAALGARAGSVALLTEDGAELQILRAAGYPEALVAPWLRFPLQRRLPISDAVRTGEMVLLTSRGEWSRLYPDLAPDTSTGEEGAWAAVPLIAAEGRIIGGMGLSFSTSRNFGDEDRAFMLTLARQCAQAIDRARLYEEAQQARERAEASQARMRFRADLSATLAASLDYETTLASMARLCVPLLADWCAVDMRQEDGSIARLAVAHIDPAKVAWAYELWRRYPPEPDAPQGLMNVLRTGQAEFYFDISDDLLVQSARDAEQLEALRAVGFRSVILAPLVARGRSLGVLTLVTTDESGRHYTLEDVAFAEELSRQAAVAVDNAVLYEEARRASILAREREEALRMQARVLESMAEGVSLSDESGIILYTNPAENAMFGYSPGELVGQHVTVQNTYPPEENQRIVSNVIAQLKARGVWQGEWDNIRKDGTTFITRARITALETGGKHFWVCVQEDITDEKRAERERAELLQTVQEAAAQQRNFLREVLFSVTEGRLRLCEGEEELPRMLQPISGKIALTTRSIRDLRRAVQEAAEAAGWATERVQDISTAVGEAAMNAVVHGGGGEARVCTSEAGRVQVWIRDQGTGIAMDDLHRATLERGFTTVGSLGHGFWLMLKTADRIWLATGLTGTTVVLEQERYPLAPDWITKATG